MRIGVFGGTFDPVIEKMEADIARLRVPATHKYELAPQTAAEK